MYVQSQGVKQKSKTDARKHCEPGGVYAGFELHLIKKLVVLLVPCVSMRSAFRKRKSILLFFSPIAIKSVLIDFPQFHSAQTLMWFSFSRDYTDTLIRISNNLETEV